MKALGTLLVFLIVGILTDVSALWIPKLLSQSRFSAGMQNFVTVATFIPWSAVIFGICFSLAVKITKQGYRDIGFEEISAFVLICPLIIIIRDRLGGFLVQVLNSFHIPGVLMVWGIHAILLGLISQHGLYLYLGAVGYLVLFLSSIGYIWAGSMNYIPAPFGAYWYTLMAVLIIVISFRSRPVGA